MVFLSIYAAAFSSADASPYAVSELFLHETLGGLLFGGLLGLIAHLMIRATDEGAIELAVTLCIPTAGFAVANLLGVSGALAMVVAGIMVGNWTRYSGFSRTSDSFLDEFWHFLDEFLNALLFLLIGLAMMVVQFHRELLLLILFAIPLVLMARFASVALPYLVFRRFRHYHSHSIRLLTWGGLRGALSLAMAISVPVGIGVGVGGKYDLRNVVVTMTYSIVLFSIIVQGMTVGSMIERAKRVESENEARKKRGRSVPHVAGDWPADTGG